VFNLPITIKQNRKFDYIYVADLMPILDWFITNQPKYHSYNITPDQSISLYELAKLVSDLSDSHPEIQIKQDGLGLEYSGSNSRLKAECDCYPQTPFIDSVTSLINWYKSIKPDLDVNLLLVDK
jgi:GDP-L-fucose synthase